MKQLVLMYHDTYVENHSESGFSSASNHGYSIKAGMFESHVKLVSEYLERNGMSKDFVRWTFDDGGVSFLTITAPILEKYGFIGNFYIATNYIGKRGFLTEEQIKDLDERGHLIGAHSHTHPARMQDLPQYIIRKEWKQSIDILERILNKKIYSVTIPGGNYSEEMRLILATLGIKEIFTTFPTDSIVHHKTTNGEMVVVGRYTIKEGMPAEEVVSIIHSPIKRLKMKLWKGFLQVFKNLLGSKYDIIKEKILG